MADDAVTQWMIDLAEGDQSAAQQLWQRYCEQLVDCCPKTAADSQSPRGR